MLRHLTRQKYLRYKSVPAPSATGIVHRFISDPSSSKEGHTSGGDHSFTEMLLNSEKHSAHELLSLNVFNISLFVTIASDKTAQDMHQALLLQTARFWRSFDIKRKRVGNNHGNGVKQTT